MLLKTGSLDNAVREFSYHWLSHHVLCAIIPCSINMVSVSVTFWDVFIVYLVLFPILWGRF